MNILEILVANKIITEQISSMLQLYSEEWGFSHFEAVIRTCILSENDLLDVISTELSLTHLFSIEHSDLKSSSCQRIDFRDACNLLCFNLGESDGFYDIVVNNPLDGDLQNFLSSRFEKYNILIAEKQLILDAAIEFYELKAKLPTFNKVYDE